MNYYFFPQIEGFESSVTLVNFPCLEVFPLRPETQIIYATWSDGKVWHYLKVGTIKPHEAKEIFLKDLPPEVPRDQSPYLFFHYLDLPAQSGKLILSDHMYFMPTWRGNIKISSPHTATSYEGDFQHEMVKYIRKGSLVSVSPMLQKGDGIINKFIMVSITENSEITPHTLRFVDPVRQKILHETIIYSNRCNVVDMAKVDFMPDTVTLAICGTLSGIPIFFTATPDGREMSFEHTHPPVSMAVFGNAGHFQKTMKSYWLTKYAA